jgi:hypothetical protein
VELAKDMAACWRNSIFDIARTIGTSPRDLKWFLNCKADLDQRAVSELLSILGIEWTEEDYEAAGPCVVVATDVHAAERVYDHLSGAGDVHVSCEVVPGSGKQIPAGDICFFSVHLAGRSTSSCSSAAPKPPTISAIRPSSTSKACERYRDAGLQWTPG